MHKNLVDIPQTGFNLYILPLSDNLYSVFLDFFQVFNLVFFIVISAIRLEFVYLLVVEITQQRCLDRCLLGLMFWLFSVLLASFLSGFTLCFQQPLLICIVAWNIEAGYLRNYLSCRRNCRSLTFLMFLYVNRFSINLQSWRILAITLKRQLLRWFLSALLAISLKNLVFYFNWHFTGPLSWLLEKRLPYFWFFC